MARPDQDIGPTTASQKALSPTLERNIEAIVERRRQNAANASLEEKAAAAISKFAGSMVFVYLHIAFFGGWILANVGLLPFLPAWDHSLVILAMVASVEAIFLSTFVLINQNRMAAEDDARSDLDLQINHLNEHETTRKPAELIGMAIHELTNNALKYGALAVAEGRLSVVWSITQDVEPLLRLDWEESGVTISDQPVRRGFGTELLQGRIAYELEAETTLRFNEMGLHCTMVVPLNRVGP